MDVRLEDFSATGTGTLAIFGTERGVLGPYAAELDRVAGGLIERAFSLVDTTSKGALLVDVVLPAGAGGWDRVLLVAPPAEGGSDANDDMAAVASSLAGAVAGHRLSSLTVQIDGAAAAARSVALVEALGLRTYRCERFGPKSVAEKPRLTGIIVQFDGAGEAAEAVADACARAAGVALARDLVNAPPNKMTPAVMVDEIKQLEKLGVEVEVLDTPAMESENMGALLGVARGSVQPPFVALMHWRGAGGEAPLALVGKGVCFDSGGLSLKPAKSMETMKMDMAGAAAVVGAMHVVASRKAKADVIGVVGLVENMPDADAQRPGDVVTSRLGKTIEVLNTDAEGRLVLADVLAYVDDRYKPSAMIDLATLTGAVIVALGDEHTGMFSNDDALTAMVTAAGDAVGESVWRLPLGKAFTQQLESDVADLRNIGKGGKAGSAVAAAFLQEFVGETPWVHLDIAGTAWTDGPNAKGPRGATGWGVRLLDRLVADGYEPKAG